jgi:YVTN family beta-propeller protein
MKVYDQFMSTTKIYSFHRVNKAGCKNCKTITNFRVMGDSRIKFSRMNRLTFCNIAMTLLAFCVESCHAQSPTQSQALHLITSIALPNVNGRIDHLSFDPDAHHLFIAALGNNSVEIVDLKNNTVIRSIKDLSEPQGICYIPGKNLFFVANGGNGVCDVFSADLFKKIVSVQLASDADNIQYDTVNGKVYVGYGNGGIAIIDAATLKQVADVKLQGHPESFQLDIQAKRLYVNVPDKQQVEIIDLDKRTVIDRWQLTAAKSNFAMALDAANHRLFIGCRHPAKLLVMDCISGKQVAAINADSDVDDVFYNQKNGDIYLSCGGGYLDVIRQQNANKYALIETIASRPGARTALFIPRINRLVVASPKANRSSAQLLVYNTEN